jgi:hypothetical protein
MEADLASFSTHADKVAVANSEKVGNFKVEPIGSSFLQRAQGAVRCGFPQSTKESPIGEIRRGSTVQGHARASTLNTGAKYGIVVRLGVA